MGSVLMERDANLLMGLNNWDVMKLLTHHIKPNHALVF